MNNIVPMPSPRLGLPINTSRHLEFDQCPKCRMWCTNVYNHGWRRHKLNRGKMLELILKMLRRARGLD